MPQTTFFVKSVSQKPARRQDRRTRVWFSVWTIERQPDDRLSLSESLAGYETTSEWAWNLCGRAQELGLPVTVLWRESPWLRRIVEVTLARKESAA